MKQQSFAGALRRIFVSTSRRSAVFLFALLAPAGTAPSALGGPVVGGGPPMGLEFSQPLYEAGEVASLTVTGPIGHVPILLIAGGSDEVMVPGLGQLGIAIQPLPAFVPLAPIGPDGTASASCQIDCMSPILKSPCFVQAVLIDPQTLMPSGVTPMRVLNVASADCGLCVEPAEVLEGCSGGSTHVFTMPPIGNDYVFVAGGAFVERGDGTGLLTGVIERPDFPMDRWMVHLEFAGRVDPGMETFPPAESPKMQLCPEAYLENGGPLDPGTWHYYLDVKGTLRGLGEFEGAVLSLDDFGPKFQIGYGASGKNLEFGGSGWFSIQIESQPTTGRVIPDELDSADINMTISDECVSCAQSPGQGPALSLPAIGQGFLLADDGVYTQLGSGMARLTGTLVNPADPTARLRADLVFAERSNPGTLSYPPEESPKLELPDVSYADDGGMLEPDLWHFYQAIHGTLSGEGSLAGAKLLVSSIGPAFQVGLGASGVDFEYGASGDLQLELLAPPLGGSFFPAGLGEGVLRMELGCR